MKLTPSKLYKTLLDSFGPQKWWPVDPIYHEKNHTDPRFEIIIGAVLTQNTAWSNVEKAINSLKKENMIDINKISIENLDTIKTLIKPSGFFNQKAVRLQNLAKFLKRKYNGDLDTFFNKDIEIIREELLGLNGIGPETADSILLYAGNKPVFVVDAYTKRICQRIPFETNISYDDIQRFFQNELSKKFPKKDLTRIYNELHALIVVLGKNYCKKKPVCSGCPLERFCKKLF